MISGLFLAVTLFSFTVLGWDFFFGGHHGQDSSHASDHGCDHDLALAPAPKTDRIPAVLVGGFRGVAYFSLGFGPMGLAGTFLGVSFLEAFLWAIGVGLAALVALRFFSRLQSKESDSSVSDAELLWETAVVTVPLEKGRMGKVRLDHKGGVVERYAVAANPDQALIVGTRVRIVELNPDSVTVVEEPNG